MSEASSLGTYLRSRREKVDPRALGLATGRRRTPGLRREEVAQRANISATWYTWLEQGRGGAPSADALDRIASALALGEVEREHLFLLGLGHPPGARYREAETVAPRLQRLLDTLTHSPAIVRNAIWDVIAWNHAAAAVLTDYSRLAPHERNILRLMFRSSAVRSRQTDWDQVARFVVGAFRIDAARAGAAADPRIAPLVEELAASSPEFAGIWREAEVRVHGDGVKRIRHAIAGTIGLEYSSFAVDGRPELSMIVYNPATGVDRDAIGRAIAALDAETALSGPSTSRSPMSGRIAGVTT